MPDFTTLLNNEVELVRMAEDAARKAQWDLRDAKQQLAAAVLEVAHPRDLIGMGVLTVNVGAIRRMARHERR